MKCRQQINLLDPLCEFLTKYNFALKNQQFDNHVFESFQHAIKNFYAHNKRNFRWRSEIFPYYVVVSEVMLQQTQTSRVEKKFDQFVQQYPDFKSLADAPLSDVLSLWVGLGYNRRAKALHLIAQKIKNDFEGKLPESVTVLKAFYGLGSATASSIVAFAFNKPTIFIETNIRAVFLHVFFNGQEYIEDRLIMPLVEATINRENVREWYYALMDYGVIIKKLYQNPARKSKHYTRQSKFEGSDRQIRGWIIASASQKQSVLISQVIERFAWATSELVEKIVSDLTADGLVRRNKEYIFLA